MLQNTEAGSELQTTGQNSDDPNRVGSDLNKNYSDEKVKLTHCDTHRKIRVISKPKQGCLFVLNFPGIFIST